jgi:cell division septal protein FtsQ
MKKRFLAILAVVICIMSTVTFVLSYFAAKGSIEQLRLERAHTACPSSCRGSAA